LETGECRKVHNKLTWPQCGTVSPVGVVDGFGEVELGGLVGLSVGFVDDGTVEDDELDDGGFAPSPLILSYLENG
jgi:hypothetical protein